MGGGGVFYIVMSTQDLHLVLVMIMVMVKVLCLLQPPTLPPIKLTSVLMVVILCHLRVLSINPLFIHATIYLTIHQIFQ